MLRLPGIPGRSAERHRLCLVFPLPSWAKILPLPCVSTAFVAKILPLPCVSTAFVAKTVPLPCGPNLYPTLLYECGNRPLLSSISILVPSLTAGALSSLSAAIRLLEEVVRHAPAVAEPYQTLGLVCKSHALLLLFSLLSSLFSLLCSLFSVLCSLFSLPSTFDAIHPACSSPF